MENHGRKLNKRQKAAEVAYTNAMVAVQRDPTAGSREERCRLRLAMNQANAELKAYLMAMDLTKYPAGPALA